MTEESLAGEHGRDPDPGVGCEVVSAEGDEAVVADNDEAPGSVFPAPDETDSVEETARPTD